LNIRGATLLLAFTLFLPAALGAQAARSPALAQAMARDGYAGRQAAAVAQIKKESLELNRRGFALYEKRDFAGAAGLFTRALAVDGGNVFARYNLACVLALAWGGREPRDTPYQTRAALVKAVARLLCDAARADVHWVYKIFLDSDLDPVRGELFSHEDFIPCPGDCCPDQWFTYRPDGTVRYGAGPPNLSGIPGVHSTPTAAADGWYAVFGDYVFVWIPGEAAILREQWPGGSLDADGDGPPADALDVFQIRRDGGNGMRLDRQTDLWEG